MVTNQDTRALATVLGPPQDPAWWYWWAWAALDRRSRDAVRHNFHIQWRYPARPAFAAPPPVPRWRRLRGA